LPVGRPGSAGPCLEAHLETPIRSQAAHPANDAAPREAVCLSGAIPGLLVETGRYDGKAGTSGDDVPRRHLRPACRKVTNCLYWTDCRREHITNIGNRIGILDARAFAAVPTAGDRDRRRASCARRRCRWGEGGLWIFRQPHAKRETGAALPAEWGALGRSVHGAALRRALPRRAAVPATGGQGPAHLPHAWRHRRRAQGAAQRQLAARAADARPRSRGAALRRRDPASARGGAERRGVGARAAPAVHADPLRRRARPRAAIGVSPGGR
jgi:hypothetical protein